MKRRTAELINSSAYFIFDSQHIDCIRPRLYGFCVTSDGIFTEAAPQEDISDEMGAWVLVRQTSEGIEVSQDSIGCFGLFLFRDGDYWALSNSFNHLLDYLKATRKLSINRDYADALLAHALCVSTYGETIISEIEWLDRRAQVLIDPSTTGLTMRIRSLEESMISVDTEKGIQILDEWHDKWATFLKKAQKSWPGIIQIDLSGGLDTRMMLALVLSSKMDVKRVKFYSNPIHEEDLSIASLIAEEYGFVINEGISVPPALAAHPVGSEWERELASIFFEKRVYCDAKKTEMPNIKLSGFGGEIVRGNRQDIKGFDRMLRVLLTKQPFDGEWRLGRGTEVIVQRSIKAIDEMLTRTNSSYKPGSLNGLQLYIETRNRTHFGMDTARRLLFQSYNLMPLLDPLMLKLRLPSGEHPLLIVALILTRYHEKLTTFPIQGGRTIPEETLQLARELNMHYPRDEHATLETVFGNNPPTWQVLKTDGFAEHRPDHRCRVDQRIIDAFESPKVQRLFRRFCGTPIKPWVDPTLTIDHPNANKYAAVVIAKAMEDVQLGKDAHANLGEFIEVCCKEPPVSERSVELKDNLASLRLAATDWPKHLKRLRRVGGKIKRLIQRIK